MFTLPCLKNFVSSQKLRLKKGHTWAKVPKIQEFFSYEIPIYPNLLRSYKIFNKMLNFLCYSIIKITVILR